MWTYELFEDIGRGWSWRLLGGDGAAVATAGRSYGSRLEARRELVRARIHAGQARIPAVDGVDDVLGEVLERIAKRDEEEKTRRASIAVLN